MATEVLTTIFHDTRRARKDGTFPVKLKITYNRERKYYPTKYSLSEEDFLKTQEPNPKKKYREIRISLNAIEQSAIEVIEKLPAFSFPEFERRFRNSVANDDVFAAFAHSAERLREAGQIRTAQSYDHASNSLLSFLNKAHTGRNKGMSLSEASSQREQLQRRKKPLPFSAVTPEFLQEYERWMLAGGKSITTVGIYLRNLRTLFNDAISNGDLHQDLYPFGKRKYQIPSGKNVKKALSMEEIGKIFDYGPRHEREARARDLWLFSYLCNGMNMKDIAKAKYRQLAGDIITFVRSKTERATRQEQRKIVVTLVPEALQIIDRWGTKPTHPEAYIFPILRDGLSPEEEIKAINQAIKTINSYMKGIAQRLGIEKNVSTYAARHSFSTILKRGGVSTAFISESLGHSSEKTTQNYLDSFEDDTRRKHAALLTAFRK
ncbi:site-specific integrase [Rufibacter aurantiacus]|uniref:site-specific integrase n=1 Tax=Rufibacter aurantiacus TaxID=2817374 RepID=UPI001B311CFB|nr:site-specific integrase [Rufibacter aurantiacus]